MLIVNSLLIFLYDCSSIDYLSFQGLAGVGVWAEVEVPGAVLRVMSALGPCLRPAASV